MPPDRVPAEVLAQLRDLHVAALAWWPPAPGWWLLAALALAIGALVLLRLRRRASPRVAARAELRRVERDFARHGDARRLTRELAELLRRAAIAAEGPAVAGLSGAAWSTYLARVAPPACDAQTWTALACSRYDPRFTPAQPAVLIDDCARWLDGRIA